MLGTGSVLCRIALWVCFQGTDCIPFFSRHIVIANKISGCFPKQSSRHTTTQHKTMQPRVLSIQPKIPDISVGTSNGTDHFGLVRPEYSGPALKVVHFDWSGHFSRSDWNVPFRLTKLLSPGSTAILYPVSKTITKRAVAWVGSVPPECTVPLSTWSFRNFKPEFLLNGKPTNQPTLPNSGSTSNGRPRTTMCIRYLHIVI